MFAHTLDLNLAAKSVKIARLSVTIFVGSVYDPDDSVSSRVMFIDELDRMMESETRETCVKYIKTLKCKLRTFIAPDLFVLRVLLSLLPLNEHVFNLCFRVNFNNVHIYIFIITYFEYNHIFHVIYIYKVENVVHYCHLN